MMTGGWAWVWGNPWMLAGLATLAVPVVIHLLNRRRDVVVDWGAMQFLDISPRTRRRIRLTDALLMAARLAVLALVALALAQPRLVPPASATAASGPATPVSATVPRDVAIVLDNSASVGRRIDEAGTTLDALLRREARQLVERLPSGSTSLLIVARERPRMDGGPRLDREAVRRAIDGVPPPRGSSDLPGAIAAGIEALQSQGTHAVREVVVLADAQAAGWRPEESARWGLLRELARGSGGRAPVEIRALSLDARRTRDDDPTAQADAAMAGPPALPRGLVPPGRTLEVRGTVVNAGPGPMPRRAVGLTLDGEPVTGHSQEVGPLPVGARATVQLRMAIDVPGSHLVGLALEPEPSDPRPDNDRAERPVEVVPSLPVLLIDGGADGAHGPGSLRGPAGFLRVALEPAEERAEGVAPAVAVRTAGPAALTDIGATSPQVIVVAGLDRPTSADVAALARFVNDGGGLLVVPGRSADAGAWNPALGALLPAPLQAWKASAPAAHPVPSSFQGPAIGRLAAGDAPPMGRAQVFGHWTLGPAVATSAVVARLDDGDPWIVERPVGRGLVALVASPLDADAGTLAVNPDFVPLVHELVGHLADPGRDVAALSRPGEPIEVGLPPGRNAGANPDVPVLRPDGTTARASVVRPRAGRVRLRLEAADDPGVYRFDLPDGPAYAVVGADEREDDLTTLTDADRQALASGWDFVFASTPEALQGAGVAGPVRGPRPLWRWLVLAALGGLALEVALTRRIVRSRGLAPQE
jgi:hypothetical protein